MAANWCLSLPVHAVHRAIRVPTGTVVRRLIRECRQGDPGAITGNSNLQRHTCMCNSCTCATQRAGQCQLHPIIHHIPGAAARADARSCTRGGGSWRTCGSSRSPSNAVAQAPASSTTGLGMRWHIFLAIAGYVWPGSQSLYTNIQLHNGLHNGFKAGFIIGSTAAPKFVP